MKLLLSLSAFLPFLTGCSGGISGGIGDDSESGSRSGRMRGLSLMQYGLVNVHSGNTYNFPTPETPRFSLDQRLRVESNGTPLSNSNLRAR